MAKMTNDEYAKSYGLECPYCRSGNIRTIDKLEADCAAAWQDAACNDCGKEWIDHFKLIGYSEVDDD